MNGSGASETNIEENKNAAEKKLKQSEFYCDICKVNTNTVALKLYAVQLFIYF